MHTVKPYTPLELAGRDIYVAEGCYNCHSQMIRPLFAETERYGEYSKAGEFIYDHPFQWGSRRIGPDLAREGGKQSHFWHFEHFRDPASMTKGSVMPAYPHLLTKTQLNFDTIPARIGPPPCWAHRMTARPGPLEASWRDEQAQQIVKDLMEQGSLEQADHSRCLRSGD